MPLTFLILVLIALILIFIAIVLVDLVRISKEKRALLRDIFRTIAHGNRVTQEINDKLSNSMLPVVVDVQSIEHALYDVAKFEKQQLKRRSRKQKRNR